MVETVVVKSLCLDLTEYNINYTKKKSKERIDKKVTGHAECDSLKISTQSNILTTTKRS